MVALVTGTLMACRRGPLHGEADDQHRPLPVRVLCVKPAPSPLDTCSWASDVE